MRLIRDRTTGRTIEAVVREATPTKPMRIELLVRNPAGTKLSDHSVVLDPQDALELVAQVTEMVAGDVPGVVGSMTFAAGAFASSLEDDDTPTTELPASRQRGPFVVHDGGST